MHNRNPSRDKKNNTQQTKSGRASTKTIFQQMKHQEASNNKNARRDAAMEEYWNIGFSQNDTVSNPEATYVLATGSTDVPMNRTELENDLVSTCDVELKPLGMSIPHFKKIYGRYNSQTKQDIGFYLRHNGDEKYPRDKQTETCVENWMDTLIPLPKADQSLNST